ncbi:hypothetical protein F8M41_020375 [Gigaspora margarita]|uniref:Uncharacterized protein n=1 Tax=Gigaspora margarita TaxID=4874 RepID=A0A8H4AIK3_GIGMA|nr:hypothetical protein F8M41_020375 [Gigaspora margarita]
MKFIPRRHKSYNTNYRGSMKQKSTKIESRDSTTKKNTNETTMIPLTTTPLMTTLLTTTPLMTTLLMTTPLTMTLLTMTPLTITPLTTTPLTITPTMAKLKQ